MSKFCKLLPKNAKNFDENFLKYWDLSGAKACKSFRSRQELSNKYLLAKIGFDRAGNEPFKVCWYLKPAWPQGHNNALGTGEGAAASACGCGYRWAAGSAAAPSSCGNSCRCTVSRTDAATRCARAEKESCGRASACGASGGSDSLRYPRLSESLGDASSTVSAGWCKPMFVIIFF